MLQSSAKYDINVYHDLLSQSSRDTLVAFYVANRALQFNFTAVEDGVLRTVVFAAAAYAVSGPLYWVWNKLRRKETPA